MGINSSIAYAFLGQFCIAFAQPFILNSLAKIVSYWFRVERVK